MSFLLFRGIFKLLVKFQLENKDNPSYTGAHTFKTSKCQTDFLHCFMIVMFSITICATCRIVIPRFLPALSSSVFGELWSHTQDSADWVQRPQTHKNTQGWSPVWFHSFYSIALFPADWNLSYMYSHNCPGCRWSGVPDCPCGCEHTDGFPGERGGWLRREGFLKEIQYFGWIGHRYKGPVTWI